MATSKPPCAKVVGWILDVLEFAIALAVILLVSWKLTKIGDENIVVNGQVEAAGQCLLGNPTDDGEPSGVGLCFYAIVVALVSLVANIVFGCVRNVVRCATCNVCATSRVVEIVGDAALAVWWAVAFGILVSRVGSANEADLSNQTAREAVVGLAFGGMTVFAIDVIITAWSFFA